MANVLYKPNGRIVLLPSGRIKVDSPTNSNCGCCSAPCTSASQIVFTFSSTACPSVTAGSSVMSSRNNGNECDYTSLRTISHSWTPNNISGSFTLPRVSANQFSATITRSGLWYSQTDNQTCNGTGCDIPVCLPPARFSNTLTFTEETLTINATCNGTSVPPRLNLSAVLRLRKLSNGSQNIGFVDVTVWSGFGAISGGALTPNTLGTSCPTSVPTTGGTSISFDPFFVSSLQGFSNWGSATATPT